MTLLDESLAAALSGTMSAETGWVRVCAASRLQPDRGLCALIDGQQIALFRTSFDELFAVANIDPISGANVISRGIVGSIGGRPTVSSPMYKQRFDLATGTCLDDPEHRLQTFAIRQMHDGIELLLS